MERPSIRRRGKSLSSPEKTNVYNADDKAVLENNYSLLPDANLSEGTFTNTVKGHAKINENG